MARHLGLLETSYSAEVKRLGGLDGQHPRRQNRPVWMMPGDLRMGIIETVCFLLRVFLPITAADGFLCTMC